MRRRVEGVCQATGLRHIAINGKAVRAALIDTISGCLVNAWAAEYRVILEQEPVAEGSQEIADIPELLTVLALKGALVTIDSAGCQKLIARQLRSDDGGYLLAVKGNQPTLYDAVSGVFDRASETVFDGFEHDGREQVEDRHGRHEERYVMIIYNPEELPSEWPDVAAVVLVGRERPVKGSNTSTSHHYIISLRGMAENELHWVLDIASEEASNRTALGDTGANLGMIRRVAVSLLRQDPGREGIKAKVTVHGSGTSGGQAVCAKWAATAAVR
ncbi:MAG TPA: ISAs1 family transposase [Isosphaeraceae bacterium]|nr:ISAs1 family transposase [Isosphaeraceae bacterium]